MNEVQKERTMKNKVSSALFICELPMLSSCNISKQVNISSGQLDDAEKASEALLKTGGNGDNWPGIGYGYVTSQMGTTVTGDPRDVALRHALDACLR